MLTNVYANPGALGLICAPAKRLTLRKPETRATRANFAQHRFALWELHSGTAPALNLGAQLYSRVMAFGAPRRIGTRDTPGSKVWPWCFVRPGPARSVRT